MRLSGTLMDRKPKHSLKDLVALAILAAFCLAIRWDILLYRQIPARGDTLTGFIPHKSFSVRTIRSGG